MKAKGSLIKQEGEFEADLKKLSQFFDDVVPEFVNEGGGILADTVKYWRWKNQVKIVKKAKKFLEKEGVATNSVPLKTMVPLLENASLEEEDSMQNKWAALLANAVGGYLEVTPNYVNILAELSPIEAAILDKIYDEEEKANAKQQALQFDRLKIAKAYKLTDDKAELIVENLIRLGLFTEPGSTSVMTGNMRMALKTTMVFEITALGKNLVRLCRFNAIS